MKRKFYFTVLLFFIVTMTGYQSLAQEEKKLSFPISNVQEIITQSGVVIDTEITTDNNGSLLINTDKAIKIELFEIDKEDFKNKRLTYKAQIRSEDLTGTEDLRGISYIELIASFPDEEELISRGPRVPVSGTTDWRPAETVLYIDKGNAPEYVKLNLIVEGQGKVWLDAVKLEAIPLRLNYLFWGYLVVWIVLIIYIYDLLRKNMQLKKELEAFS
ncbi:MAG: hypothetical protein ACERKJ_01690 [Candidatus Dadabacteria bacterium]|jgi:hypothetical protein